MDFFSFVCRVSITFLNICIFTIIKFISTVLHLYFMKFLSACQVLLLVFSYSDEPAVFLIFNFLL